MTAHNPLCSAHSKQTGLPCKRLAISGANVCRYHGGAAPQVKAKAAERLRAMINPALGVLEYAMKQKAKQLPAAINAAKEVLDRAKFEGDEAASFGGPQVAIQVNFISELPAKAGNGANGHALLDIPPAA
jgi:hypothetical protein